MFGEESASNNQEGVMTVWKETILAGILCALPALGHAQTTAQSDAAGIREAIRFERAKDAADARQARMEARHPTVYAEPGEADREDAAMPGRRVGDPGELAGRSQSAQPKDGKADTRTSDRKKE